VSDDHLSLDELAELDEGLLPPERVSAARSHLDGCDECRARLESITVTRTLLADLPAVTMPPEVQTRLEQALADEAAGSARSTTIVPNVVDLPRRRLGRPTMAASAAAAAVVLIIGAIVVAKVDSHSNNGDSGGAGTSAAGALAPNALPNNQVGNPNFPTSISGVTYTPTSLPADIENLLRNTAGQSAGSTLAPLATAPQPTSTSSAAASAAPTTSKRKHGGKKPTPTSLHVSPGAQADGALAGAGLLPAALKPLAASRTSLLNCAENLDEPVGTFPVAIDFARWTAPAIGTSTPAIHDAPSLIVVFPYAGNTYLVDVVAPACDGSSIRRFQQVTLPN
jgi:hypothetical protein